MTPRGKYLLTSAFLCLLCFAVLWALGQILVMWFGWQGVIMQLTLVGVYILVLLKDGSRFFTWLYGKVIR